MEKRSIQVEIGGISYSLKTDENPEELAKVIRFVDEKIQNLSGNTNVTSQTKIAVLAALNIASELFQLKETHQQALEKLASYEAESKAICDNIDWQLNKYLENKA